MALVGSLTVGVPAPAFASTELVVTVTDDVPATGSTSDGTCEIAGGGCSLRAAIQESNGTPGDQTIRLAPAAVYDLTVQGAGESAAATGDLDISASVVIEGGGATVRAEELDPDGTPFDGNGPLAGDRAFEVRGGATATLRHLTITRGNPGADPGGGVLVSGAAHLDRVILLQNATTGSGGGAFYGSGSSGGSVVGSLLIANSALKGGGMRARVAVPVSWSTFIYNTATSTVDGAAIMGEVGNPSPLTGTAMDAQAGGAACRAGGTGITSGGENLVADTSCALAGPGDVQGVPTLLGFGQPQPGSPAIDTGGSGCPTADVAGGPRPRGLECDKGASEVPFPALVVTSTVDEVDLAAGDGACASASGVCTLRAAIQEANALAGPDTVALAEGATYPLTRQGANENASATGDLDVLGALTLQGNGAWIDAGGLDPDGTGPLRGDRVLHARPGSSVTLERVLVTKGDAADKPGGGVLVEGGSLRLDRSLVIGNRTDTSGGGLFVNSASTGAVVTQSVLVGNTADRGGGLRTMIPMSVEWSTISYNTALTPTYAAGVFAGQPVTMTGSIVVSGAGQTDCYGTIVTGGHNLSSGTSCMLTGPGDLASVSDPRLDWGIGLLPDSPAIDAGGASGCPAADGSGTPRPRYASCDIGAVEFTSRDRDELWSLATDDLPTSGPQVVPRHITRAFASYALGRDAEGDAAIDALVAAGYPELPAPGGSLLRWDGEFLLVLLEQLLVVDPPATWANPADPQRQAVEGMIDEYVAHCRYDDGDADATPEVLEDWLEGVWTWDSSENHHLNQGVSCLYALYHLGDPAWQDWSGPITTWLRESAVNGLLSEINSPGYSDLSLQFVLAMRRFPGDAGMRDLAGRWLDLYWHELATNYNAIAGTSGASGTRTYQPNPDGGDVTLTYPLGFNYQYPTSSYAVAWLWLYGWHDLAAVPVDDYLALAAADAYRPLDISRQVAQATGKDIEVDQVRPVRFGAAPGEPHGIVRQATVNDDWMLGATTTDPSTYHHQENLWFAATINNAARNDRVMISGIGELKASKYDNYNDLGAINGVVEGGALIAARDTKTESLPANPTVDPPATSSGVWGNSRGVRVAFSPGPLRDNLVQDPSGWWFTRSGSAFVAARFAYDPAFSQAPFVTVLDSSGKVKELRVQDDHPNPAYLEPSLAPNPDTNPCSTKGLPNAAGTAFRNDGYDGTACCTMVDTVDRDETDCWSPLVVQMGRAADYPGAPDPFQAFKAAVLAGNRFTYSVNPTTGVGTLQYTSLEGDVLAMDRQEPALSTPTKVGSLPRVNGVDVDTTPDWRYRATQPGVPQPYLAMPWTSRTATLCGPVTGGTQSCTTRAFP